MKLSVFKHNEYLFAVLSRIIYTAAGLLANVLIARYLGAELKGEVSSIQNIVAVTSVFFSLGLHQVYPIFRKKEGSSFTHKFMGPASLLTGFCILVSAAIALISRSRVISVSALLTPLFVFSMISGFVLLIEAPNKLNQSRNIFAIIQLAAAILFMICVRKSLFPGVLFICLPELLLAGYAVIALKWNFSGKKESLSELMLFSAEGFLPMTALLLTNLNYRVGILLLQCFPNISFAEIGIYTIGISVAEKTWIISDAAKEILVSKLSKGRDADEAAHICRLCFPLTALLAAGLILIGKPAIRILFGAEFQGAYHTALLALAGIVFIIFFKMISQYNLVNGRQKTNIAFLAVSIILQMVCGLILIPRMGINGAALSVTISYTICAFLFVLDFSRSSRISLRHLFLPTRSDFQFIKKS